MNRYCGIWRYASGAYYADKKYHGDWVRGVNANWTAPEHSAQMKMCRFIPRGARVLEVGCGDGAGAYEISKRTIDIEYVGVDWNAGAWCDNNDFRFLEGSATGFTTPIGIV